jgi:hypothetical protein
VLTSTNDLSFSYNECCCGRSCKSSNILVVICFESSELLSSGAAAMAGSFAPEWRLGNELSFLCGAVFDFLSGLSGGCLLGLGVSQHLELSAFPKVESFGF